MVREEIAGHEVQWLWVQRADIVAHHGHACQVKRIETRRNSRHRVFMRDLFGGADVVADVAMTDTVMLMGAIDKRSIAGRG